MTAEALEGLRLVLDRRRTLGIHMDGRYCLACGRPLFGPELLHTPPDEESLSVVDSIRWRTSDGYKNAN